MNKIVSMFMILLLVLAMIPIAIAQEDNSTEEGSDETENSDDESDSEDNQEETDDESDDDSDEESEEETDSDDTDEEDNEEEDSEEETDSDTDTDDEETEESDDDSDASDDEESDDDNDEESEEEEEEIDESTEEELAIMHNGKGAEIRLLQLIRKITRNILIGERVIEYIQDTTDEDTTGLEETLAELEVVLDEVETLDPSDNDEGDAQQFVELKKESIELTQSFRKEARELLDESDVETLRSEIEDIDMSEVDAITEELQTVKNAYHAEKLQSFLEKFGKTNDKLIEQVRSGEVNVDNIKKRIRNAWDDLSASKKRKIVQRIKEDSVQRKAFRSAVKDTVRDHYQQNKEVRKQKRSEHIEAKKTQVRDRIKAKKLAAKDRVQEKKSDVRANVQDKKAHARDKAQDKAEKLRAAAQARADKIDEGIAASDGGIEE